MSLNKNKYFTSALHLLNEGVPLAIPTETVYGLAASISNPIAIRQIFAVKERPIDHPLIIHVSSIEMAKKYGHFSPKAFDLVRRFWPGPLTVILPKKDSVPLEVTGGRETVGIRQPNHPLTLKLIQEHGCPIAAPSANRFGRVSPTSAEHVLEDFNGKIAVLDGGPCSIGLESTIVDLSTNQASVRRLGAITEEDVITIVGKLYSSDTAAPGTLKAHYAPLTSLLLSSDVTQDASRLEKQGLCVATLNIQKSEDFAPKLYSELRRLDKLRVDVLVIEKPEATGIGKALLDRLTKASYGSPSLP